MVETELSVLDALLWENHEVTYQVPEDARNTLGTNYLLPARIIPWREFNSETLLSIDQGKLRKAAVEAKSRQPGFPYVSDHDLKIVAEDHTKHLITITSNRIVQAGLDAVQDSLPTSYWTPWVAVPRKARRKSRAASSRSSAPALGDSSSLPSPASSRVGGSEPGRFRGRRLYPDSGAVFQCGEHGILCGSSKTEILPKDYKTYPTWRSSYVIEEMLEKDGTWKWGEAIDHNAYPIRQAYTYCVMFGCRYGCILTTHEAFIFRVKAGHPKPRRSPQTLKETLREEGLIEYVTVPWILDDATANKGSSSNSKKQKPSVPMTYNLALWYIHILAAANHELDWDYPKLKLEKLEKKPCQHLSYLVTPNSTARDRRPGGTQVGREGWVNRRKRPRENELVEDDLGDEMAESQEVGDSSPLRQGYGGLPDWLNPVDEAAESSDDNGHGAPASNTSRLSSNEDEHLGNDLLDYEGTDEAPLRRSKRPKRAPIKVHS